MGRKGIPAHASSSRGGGLKTFCRIDCMLPKVSTLRKAVKKVHLNLTDFHRKTACYMELHQRDLHHVLCRQDANQDALVPHLLTAKKSTHTHTR